MVEAGDLAVPLGEKPGLGGGVGVAGASQNFVGQVFGEWRIMARVRFAVRPKAGMRGD